MWIASRIGWSRGCTRLKTGDSTRTKAERFWPPQLDAPFESHRGMPHYQLRLGDGGNAVIIEPYWDYRAPPPLPESEWHILDLAGLRLQHLRVTAQGKAVSAMGTSSGATRTPLQADVRGASSGVRRVVWWDGDRPEVEDFVMLEGQEGLDGSLVFVDPEAYEPGGLEEGCPGREPLVPVTFFPARGGRFRTTIPRPTAWTALPERSLLVFESCERLYRIKLPDGMVELLSERIDGMGTTVMKRSHGTDMVEVGRYGTRGGETVGLWNFGVEPPQLLLSLVSPHVEVGTDWLLARRGGKHELWTIRQGQASLVRAYEAARVCLRGHYLQLDEVVEDLLSGQTIRLPTVEGELFLDEKVGGVWLLHDRSRRALVWNPKSDTLNGAPEPAGTHPYDRWNGRTRLGEHLIAKALGDRALLYRPEDDARLTIIARSSWGVAVAPDGRRQLLYGERKAAAAGLGGLSLPPIDTQRPLLQRMLAGDPL